MKSSNVKCMRENFLSVNALFLFSLTEKLLSLAIYVMALLLSVPCFSRVLSAESAAPESEIKSTPTQTSQNPSPQRKNVTSLPEYIPAVLGETELTSVGSDSMGGLVELWVEAYKNYQKHVSIQVASRGSATAAAALINGSADFGPMARPMKVGEVDEFKSKYGFEPTFIRTAIAGVAIYVAQENTLQKISFRELDAIYSILRKRGNSQNIKTWGELGLQGELASEMILPFGLASNMMSNDYFRQQVLLQGEFIPTVATTASTDSLLEAISLNKNAIGFGEVRGAQGQVAQGQVKVIAVSKEPESAAFLPNQENLVSGDYPLGRYLNVYVVRYPHQPLDRATRDFLRFVLSRQGQEIVEKQGLIPLPLQVVTEELAKL